MDRNYNTDKYGKPFSEVIKRAVWNKGIVIKGIDPKKIRKDHLGRKIRYDKYGDTTENGFGWEIDHIKPVVRGGSDKLKNLQPLHWKNNRIKGEKLPYVNYRTNKVVLN